MAIRFVYNRDGELTRFRPEKIRHAISMAVGDVFIPNPDEVVEKIYALTIQSIEQHFNDDRYPKISDIEETVMHAASEEGFNNVATAYFTFKEKRTKVRENISIMSSEGTRSTTDAALLIESDSKESLRGWDRSRIVEQLQEEANLERGLATDISKKVENFVYDMWERGVRRLNTIELRGLVDIALEMEGLHAPRRKQALLGMPSSDLESIIYSRSHENSNIASNNPEAVNLEIAERIQKEFALANIFSPEVAEAHRKGAIHVHDLGYPTRVYCSSHSLEYIKKYGLRRLLANLESKSNSPNSADVLNQHVQTYLASMQAHYAGALGFGFLNIFYAPLLNRPVEVVRGKMNGQEFSFEKRDLEKLVEQGQITTDQEDKSQGNYFEITSKRKELRKLSSTERYQVGQKLIFASSQNAFSRGGQTLFIDFNVHAGVPKYMKNVPAIGPGGNYMVQLPDGEVVLVKDIPRYQSVDDPEDVRNGDADDSKLEGRLKGGKILTYGFFEEDAQAFAMDLLEVWRRGDADGRNFHFPKCDLHIDETSLTDPKQKEIVDFASQVAAENGSVYFMFDRGDGAVLAQCCRLKERITDPTMLKYPERLRFCGFQNVTINVAQAAYRGGDLEGTLRELDSSMELAYEAHQQKKGFMQKLLDTEGSPQRNLGRVSDDGSPFLDLQKSTYIIGLIAVNEAVQVLTGKQLHESEEAYNLGLRLVAHMNKRAQEFKKRSGLKFTLEETPAESTTRRMAKVDLHSREHGGLAKRVIKGTEENPYYTNSIHFAPDARVSLIDRIVGQSNFHDMIESGAIVHAYIGEQRPDPQAIASIVKKTLLETRCSQLVFSPTYTECDECGTIMPGDKDLCITSECKNSSEETLDKRTLGTVTRIVGYYSRIDHWNGSQLQIFRDRKSAEEQYAGGVGDDMSWLYHPNGHERTTAIQFAKYDCYTCKNLEANMHKILKKIQADGKVDYRTFYLAGENEKGELIIDEDGLVQAARYGIPLDVAPSLVIAGRGDYWKKTTRYKSAYAKPGEPGSKADLISPTQIEAEITRRIQEYETVPEK